MGNIKRIFQVWRETFCFGHGIEDVVVKEKVFYLEEKEEEDFGVFSALWRHSKIWIFFPEIWWNSVMPPH